MFTYGTLMRGLPLHGLLAARARFLGEGIVAARLLDLGRYPGAVPDPAGRVRGEVWELASPDVWPALDSAEGPQYHRSRTTVVIGKRSLEAFIYWYRGPLDRGVPIPGGDWRAHAPARSIHRSPRD
ncbi:MAG TPA: gamma-glutamylcyclotransferase family protein [Methylomirabilota bacterium]|nr:gamma-glutamylcyclotransferase family protein [Methylomirabilota bacterium]